MSTTTTKKAGHELNFSLFGIAILIANAVLTFGFGMYFGQEIIDTGSAGLSKFLGGLMMILFFDLAALGWFAALKLSDQSPRQRSIAGSLALVSIIASTLVSAIQLGLTTTLIDLSSSHDLIGTIGLGLVVSIAAAHFIGFFQYKSSSVAAQQADLEAERQATLAQAKLDNQRLIDEKTIEFVDELMVDEVETLARLEAQKRVRLIKSGYHAMEQQSIEIEEAQLDELPPPPSGSAASDSALPQVEISTGDFDPRAASSGRGGGMETSPTTPPSEVTADPPLAPELLDIDFDAMLNSSGNGQAATGTQLVSG